MEIRKLTSSDYDQAIELYYELDEYHAHGRPDYFVHRDKEQIYPREHFVHNIMNPICLSMGAFDGEKLAGFVEATLWNESGMVKDILTVCLDNIYVLPEYRRKGIAAKLFVEVEAWARERGAVRMDLHTWDFNKGAIAMYEAMGMRPQRYVFEKKL